LTVLFTLLVVDNVHLMVNVLLDTVACNPARDGHMKMIGSPFLSFAVKLNMTISFSLNLIVELAFIKSGGKFSVKKKIHKLILVNNK
jgi:hypothetical protein